MSGWMVRWAGERVGVGVENKAQEWKIYMYVNIKWKGWRNETTKRNSSNATQECFNICTTRSLGVRTLLGKWNREESPRHYQAPWSTPAESKPADWRVSPAQDVQIEGCLLRRAPNADMYALMATILVRLWMDVNTHLFMIFRAVHSGLERVELAC